jgi:hypothetical protein
MGRGMVLICSQTNIYMRFRGSEIGRYSNYYATVLHCNGCDSATVSVWNDRPAREGESRAHSLWPGGSDHPVPTRTVSRAVTATLPWENR